MTDPVLVLRKLATLREHADRARRRRPSTLQFLEADVDIQDALAMSLFVAVQEATDIAFHIGSDEGWGVPSSYAPLRRRHRALHRPSDIMSASLDAPHLDPAHLRWL